MSEKKTVRVTEAQVRAARMLVQRALEKGEVPDRITMMIAEVSLPGEKEKWKP